MKKFLLSICAVSLLLIGAVGGYQLNSFLTVDSCLDAGGAWDDQRGSCLYSEVSALELYIKLGKDAEQCQSISGVWEGAYRYCILEKD